jgi:uncharacterized SAM-binding protein YcdF (DUF218 family)
MIVLMFGSGNLFVLYVISYRNSYDTTFDNIVVLTGGRDRISYAFSLIESYKPKNIFISGVYEKTTLQDILPQKPIENVRIILGKQAKNTEENAKEIDEWVRQNSISEILLITSDYHMMRSIMELRRINNELKIYPCSVNSIFNMRFYLQCFKEFYKIVYIYCKNLLVEMKNICCL